MKIKKIILTKSNKGCIIICRKRGSSGVRMHVASQHHGISAWLALNVQTQYAMRILSFFYVYSRVAEHP